MFHSRQKRVLFISIPKTASTSIQNFLAQNEAGELRKLSAFTGEKRYSDHISIVELESIMGDELRQYKTVCMVRNPFERATSAYFYNKQGLVKRFIENKSHRKIRVLIKIILSYVLPFNLWIRVYPLRSMSAFVCDAKGCLLVDYFLKMEQFEDSLEFLSSLFDIQFPSSITILNQSKKKASGESLFWHCNKKYLRKKHSADFSNFKYL